jgi:hypothetical protein
MYAKLSCTVMPCILKLREAGSVVVTIISLLKSKISDKTKQDSGSYLLDVKKILI